MVRFPWKRWLFSPNGEFRNSEHKKTSDQRRSICRIIGSVGSGKSTFLKLVAGVYTPTTGNISFGAYDTTAINQADLRRDVAYLGQSPGIFAGSVRDNLIIGQDDISDEKITEIIKLTGFELVLKQLPNGLSFNLSKMARSCQVDKNRYLH